MKLSHIIVFFVLIILPITLVIGVYLDTETRTVQLKNKYDAFLIDSTYDGMKAFQLNSFNNEYSTISNSKIRDIEAAIKTYFSTLKTNMKNAGSVGYDLHSYTPAILFSLYDGYYIYSLYEDTELKKDTSLESAFTYGVKPYIYYSCRYKYGTRSDFVVNYTLDNTITFIGTIDDQYVTKTGHLISKDLVDGIGKLNEPANTLNKTDSYDVLINKLKTNKEVQKYFLEQLKEDLIILREDRSPEVVKEDLVTPEFETFYYMELNSQKIYQEHPILYRSNGDICTYGDIREMLDNGTLNSSYEFTFFPNGYDPKRVNITIDHYNYFFYTSEYTKNYIQDLDMLAHLNDRIVSNDSHHNKYDGLGKQGYIISDNGLNYYIEAMEFTKWVNENDILKNITQEHAVETDKDGNIVKLKEKFVTDLGTEKIFNTEEVGNKTRLNNPLLSYSTFNEHRMNVIRYSITSNLVSAISNYNDGSDSGYEFVLPNFTEADWGKIENNICMVTFLQGIPIGMTLYNNYCVLANNTNKEGIDTSSLYIIETTNTGTQYHKIGCRELLTKLSNKAYDLHSIINESSSPDNVLIDFYISSDYKRRYISLTGSDSNAAQQALGLSSNNIDYAYYYHHSDAGCYNCIVNIADTLTADEIISRQRYNSDLDVYENLPFVDVKEKNALEYLRRRYIVALGRARFELYIVNGYFGT